MDFTEKTIDSKKIFTGKIIDVRVDTIQLPNGKKSTREIVEHHGGVGIIPITHDNKVIMVKQYRKPVEGVCLEIPAGKLEQGEDPYDCGIRELEEETGYKAANVQWLGSFYSTPGFTNEILHIYMATDLYKGKLNPDVDEFIETQLISLDELYRMVMDGELKDSKSAIAILKAYYILKTK